MRSESRIFVYLGSSCIYPRHANQPMKEEELLCGPLEPTIEAYAITKIAGIKLCQSYRKQYGSDFISAMPTRAELRGVPTSTPNSAGLR